MDRTLQELERSMSSCTLCRLSAGRTQVVFGVGDPHAEVMFIGEGPGSNEDREGIPFVGPAGKLLNTLLGEVGIPRESVYITNVVLCRPPGNRDPLPDEIEACKPRLLEHVSLVDPRLVVTLGNFATRVILNRQVGITRVRGQRFRWEGRMVVPTYHPAAILRGGSGRLMEEARQDFAQIRDVLRGPVATPAAAPAAASPAEPGLASDDPVEEQLGLF